MNRKDPENRTVTSARAFWSPYEARKSHEHNELAIADAGFVDYFKFEAVFAEKSTQLEIVWKRAGRPRPY